MTLKKAHIQQQVNTLMTDILRALNGAAVAEVQITERAIRDSVRTQIIAGVESAVEQSTILLEAHADQVASLTQLGHTKESAEIPVAADGTMTLGTEIPHAVDFSSDSQAAVTASTSNDGSPALLAAAMGEDGTGAVGTGEAAGLYGEASGAAGVGVAGKASNPTGTAGAFLVESDHTGDILRLLKALGVVFRVRADGSTEIGGSLTLPVRTVTANATAADADYLILVGTRAAGVTITLPDAALHAGRQLVVKDASGQAATWAITVDTDGGDIDGTTTDSLSTNYGSRRYASDGSDWFSW